MQKTKQKNVQEMKREEVVMELAKFAHQDWYLSLLMRSTAALKALLVYYREGADSELITCSLKNSFIYVHLDGVAANTRKTA